jgi:hypothetical protein
MSTCSGLLGYQGKGDKEDEGAGEEIFYRSKSTSGIERTVYVIELIDNDINW